MTPQSPAYGRRQLPPLFRGAERQEKWRCWLRHTQIVLAIRSGMCYDKCCLRRVPQAYMEAYRSGHNEPHSKCGCPFRARGFESHRFRQANSAPLLGAEFAFCKGGGIRTRKHILQTRKGTYSLFAFSIKKPL